MSGDYVGEVRYSINRFPGDGSTVVRELNFAGGYLSTSHIKAYTTDSDGIVHDLDFTWTGPNTVTLPTPTPTGSVETWYRDTPKDAPIANFTDGAVVSEKNLDTNAAQAVFIAAETFDRSTDVGSDVDTRAIKVPYGEVAPTLPARDTVKGKLLLVDHDGSLTGIDPTHVGVGGVDLGDIQTAIDELQATTGDNTAAISTIETAMTTADAALSSRVDGLAASTMANAAAITTVSTAAADGDAALSTRIDQLTAAAGTFRTFSQASAPTDGMNQEDLWFDTDDGNKLYRYDGTDWVAKQDGAIAAVAAAVSTEETARATADDALSTRIDNVVATAADNTANITTIATTAADALTASSTLTTTVAAALRPAPNLLINGDFKDGLTGWTQSPAGSWVETSWTEAGAIALHDSRAGATADYIYTEVSVIAGIAYSASFECSCYNDPASRVDIQWLDASGAVILVTDGIAGGAMGWGVRYASGLVTAPTGAVKARLIFFVLNGTTVMDITRVMLQPGEPTAWRDDASLGNLAGRVTTTASAIADTSGKVETRLTLLADAGNGRAQVSIHSDSYGSAGVDIVGDVNITGSVKITGIVTASAFVTDQGVDLAALVPGTLGLRWGPVTPLSSPLTNPTDGGNVSNTIVAFGTLNISTAHRLRLVAAISGYATSPDFTTPTVYSLRLMIKIGTGSWTYTGLQASGSNLGNTPSSVSVDQEVQSSWAGSAQLGLQVNCSGKAGAVLSGAATSASRVEVTAWK